MKKKLLMTTIGLVTGIAVFSTTAFVALANISNYETYKKGFFKLIRSDNFTADMKVGFEFDDDYNVEMISKIYQGSNKAYEIEQSTINGEVKKEIAHYRDEDSYITYNDSKIVHEGTYSSYTYQGAEITKSQEKLMDVIMDMGLGDLKNNIVSEENKIFINVEEYQIPAIAHAIFDVAREAVIAEKEYQEEYHDSYSDEDEEELMQKLASLISDSNTSLKFGTFEGEFNSDGYITKAKGKVTIASKDHSLDFYLDFNFSDFGTTNPVKPDITEISEDYYETSAKEITIESSGDRIIMSEEILEKEDVDTTVIEPEDVEATVIEQEVVEDETEAAETEALEVAP